MADNNVGFSWTDDSIESLLQACIDYKVQCEFKAIDWESVPRKYDDIRKIMVKDEEADKEFTKARVAAKLKKIRASYRQAVDIGKRSGGGRIVAMFYDSCQKLWGGSPAVTSIDEGNYYCYNFHSLVCPSFLISF